MLGHVQDSIACMTMELDEIMSILMGGNNSSLLVQLYNRYHGNILYCSFKFSSFKVPKSVSIS